MQYQVLGVGNHPQNFLSFQKQIPESESKSHPKYACLTTELLVEWQLFLWCHGSPDRSYNYFWDWSWFGASVESFCRSDQHTFACSNPFFPHSVSTASVSFHCRSLPWSSWPSQSDQSARHWTSHGMVSIWAGSVGASQFLPSLFWLCPRSADSQARLVYGNCRLLASVQCVELISQPWSWSYGCDGRGHTWIWGWCPRLTLLNWRPRSGRGSAE